MKYKVGDKVRRCLPYHIDDIMDGIVTEIKDEIVICEFIIDRPRITRFNQETGIDVNGAEYGIYQSFNRV